MSKPTPLYLAMMVEVERCRLRRGISMDRMSELMGTAERSYAKMLYPDNPSGRIANWSTLQSAVDVLFCDGFDLRLDDGTTKTLTTEGTKKLIQAEAAHWNAQRMRQRMSSMGRLGADKLNGQLTPEQRKASAGKAIRARWQRYRELRDTRLAAYSPANPSETHQMAPSP